MVVLATSLAAMLANPSAQEAQDQPAATPPALPCAAEEYRAFDFWIGEWSVVPNGSDQQVATSRIERVSNGCAIRETWMPLSGGDGASLTARDPEDGSWHQLWIGSQPGRVHFEGGPVDGGMVLTGYWGTDSEGVPQLVRMTYTMRDDGTVRQHGQASSDEGENWTDSFDFIYRPIAG